MEPANRVRRIEELLAHREWVSRVARALVTDDARANDLEQDVWTSVLGSPPADPPRSVRAWLATVLRFKAIDGHRAERRRRDREIAAARPEALPATDEVVARGEILRNVVAAVMDLDEPYRTAILLRYFEDRSPPDIAARTGAPLETVRTRLRRGLERLRDRLDGIHGGDRGAWMGALLPLAGGAGQGAAPAPRGSGTGALAGAGLAASIVGGFVMGMKASGAAMAVGAVLGALLLWTGQQVFSPATEPAGPTTGTNTAEGGAPGTTRSPAAGPAADPAAAPRPSAGGLPAGGSSGSSPSPAPAATGVILRVKHPAGRTPRNVTVVELAEGDEAAPSGGGRGGRGGGGRRLYWSPGQPLVRLEPGVHRLQVTDGEWTELRSEPITVTVGASGPPEERAVTLAESPGLRISAVTPPGGEWERLMAFWLLVDGERQPDDAALLHAENGTTLPRGRDHVQPDLPPGRYVVVATLDRERILARETVEVVDRLTPVVLRPAFGDDNSLEIRLKGPGGKPLSAESFHVLLGWRGEDGSYSGGGGKLVEIDAGRYRMVVPARPRGLSPGSPAGAGYWELGLSSADWGERRLPLRFPDPTGLTVSFEETASLEVEIEGFRESGLAGRLKLFIEGSGSGPTSQGMHRFSLGEQPNESVPNRGVPSDDGVAVLPGLPTGDVELVVGLAMPDTAPRCRPVLAKTIRLSAGKNRVRLPLPSLDRVVVEGEGFEEGHLVWLSGSRVLDHARSPAGTVKADAQGKAVFDHLPPGDYVVRTYQEKELREMLLRVEGPATVRFQAAPATALVVTAVEPGGALQRLGFRVGDRIVSAGGQPLATSVSLEEALRQAKLSGRAPLAVGVERGGATISIDVDAAVLDSGRADFMPGGAVEAVAR